MRLFKVNEIQTHANLQSPLRTGTVIDQLFSINKGIMPSSITMIPGQAGIGKTTVCIDILKTVKIQNPSARVLFISVEMNKVHLYRYSKRLNFGEIPICIFDLEQNILQQLNEILAQSWDLVLIDSFQQLVNLISVYDKISSRQAELQVIKSLDACRLGENEKGVNTAFLCTMHMTKSDHFAGSAYIKFMIDGMLELKKDEENEFLKYMSFSKNRDGKTGVKLYYSIAEHGIEYNMGRYNEDIQALEDMRKYEDENQVNNNMFNETFNN